MRTIFQSRARTVTAVLGASALVLVACAEDGSGTATTETETTTATETATETTTDTSAAAAAEVTTITSSNCEFDDAPTDEGTGETSGGESDRDITTNPEIATGFRAGMQAVETQNFSVATANPVATKAACDVLLAGGTAADAVVTAQFVLGLTEPQSSGLGGGGYILYHDAATGEIVAIDGREVAPLAADENYLRHISAEDQNAPVPDARRSGRSIGVPGMVAALGTLHERFGAREWAENLTPASDIATQGFEISPRMAASVESSAEDLARDPAARAYFLDDEGDAKEAGTLLQNPEYAAVVDTLASDGPDAFYTGEIAQGIVESATSDADGMTPSLMTTADLAGYTPVVHEALCAPYRDTLVCGMPPSSSGGVAVLETLRLLDAHDLARFAPDEAGPDGALPDPEAVHLVSEAQRLAYADRDTYIADPAFTDIPGGVEVFLSDDYIDRRGELIDPGTSMGTAQPGELVPAMALGADLPEQGTTHISVIDADGNAASATTSIEAGFGSFHMTQGFLLNNQLTDFSAEPVSEDGEPVANRVEAAKRPRSSMSPLLVFDRGEGEVPGDLRMVLGSPGGSLIIQYVTKTLINIVDWDMNPQQAVSAPNFGARNTPETGLGGEHPLMSDADDLVSALEDLGHEVTEDDQSSGLSALVVTDTGIIGGADPRREGIVLGG